MENQIRPGARTPRSDVIALCPGVGPLVNAVVLDDAPLGACTRDPDRWTMTADEGAKAICRGCPRRWRCARQACETPAAEGIWAGILIPDAGRGRQFALKQLRSLAEQNGFPVRSTTRAVGQSPAGAGGSIAS
jgi:WhiB family transcriptional regulator, redox-sensing transcriptional regulator